MRRIDLNANMADDPRILSLSARAFREYVRALCRYSEANAGYMDNRPRNGVGRELIEQGLCDVDGSLVRLRFEVVGRSPRTSLAFPDAVRPLALVRTDEHRAWHRARMALRRGTNRREIIDRDGLVCGICNGDIEDAADVHIDHIIPVSRGDSNEPSNLRVTHSTCNLQKGDRV